MIKSAHGMPLDKPVALDGYTRWSMVGHSKWKQIKHYKAATDKKRGALFTRLVREITMAAKLGGGDPDGIDLCRLVLV